jgi:hypothetical protein
VVLLGGASVVGSAPPAAAADRGVQLSLDGAHWSSTLSRSMFGDVRVVPGDVVDATLWVRNASTVTARLSIRAAEGVGTADDALAGNLSLQVDGAPVSGGATWQGPLLAPAGQAAIPLAVTFDADATGGMLAIWNVLDTVVLTEDTSAETGTAPGTSDGVDGAPASSDGAASEGTGTPEGAAAAEHAATTARLAATGAELGAVAVGALAAVAIGVLLVWRRRREDDDTAPRR